jgi:hypothetical protein
MQASRGSSQQAEGQGADPRYPKGGGPASRLACVAQPVVYEQEIDGPVPPVLARLYLRDGCFRALKAIDLQVDRPDALAGWQSHTG